MPDKLLNNYGIKGAGMKNFKITPSKLIVGARSVERIIKKVQSTQKAKTTEVKKTPSVLQAQQQEPDMVKVEIIKKGFFIGDKKGNTASYGQTIYLKKEIAEKGVIQGNFKIVK